MERIIQAIQNKEFETIEDIDLIIKSQYFLDLITKVELNEAQLLYSKVQMAIDIINTQKELLLDELTLLQKSKKALTFYTP